MKVSKTFVKQVTLLTGTTVGAGIFALPYAFLLVGPLLGLILFALALGLVIFINLSYGWVVVKTAEKHELAGYASFYLGKLGKFLSVALLVILGWGALLVYASLSGSFLAQLFNNPHLPFIFGLYYFVILAALVLLGIKVLAKIDLILVPLVVILVLTLFAVSLPKISWSEVIPLVWSGSVINWLKILEVFGVFLFALSGFSIIPDLLHLGQEKKKGLSAVLTGSLLPALIYLIFTLCVLGVSGSFVSSDALSGMAGLISTTVLRILLLLGVLTTATAFLGLGNVLLNMFEKDLKTPHCWSWFFVIYPPLLGYLFLENKFLEILGITGFTSTIILMIIVGLMWRRVAK